MGNVTSGSPVGFTQKTRSCVRNVQSRLCLVPGHYVTFPRRPEKQGIEVVTAEPQSVVPRWLEILGRRDGTS